LIGLESGVLKVFLALVKTKKSRFLFIKAPVLLVSIIVFFNRKGVVVILSKSLLRVKRWKEGL
jgi:hypothetical protein